MSQANIYWWSHCKQKKLRVSRLWTPDTHKAHECRKPTSFKMLQLASNNRNNQIAFFLFPPNPINLMATCVVCTYTKCGMMYNTSICPYTKCDTLYNTSIWAYPKCVIIYNTSIWAYTNCVIIYNLCIPGTKNVSVSLFVNMASPINVSHGTKTVSTSLFFNTVRISDKKFTCAAVNHATSQFAHKKKANCSMVWPRGWITRC